MAKEGPRAIDVFLEIAKTLKNNGVEIAALDDGALRRFFNETIKTSRTKEETQQIDNVKKQNEGKKEEEKTPEPQPKAKILHDSMLPNMSAHEKELEDLILKYTKKWDDKISDEFINEFEAIFDKLNDDLKDSPKWQEFWFNLKPKPENIEHVKDRILMAYRFKMFQMITGKLKAEKEPKLNEKGEPIQVPKMGEDKKPIQGEFTTVMKPKYDIKKVASLDVVLQKLNGSYDRRKAANKTLREQFNSEYENESGPGYVVDLNIMLAEAKKMRLEGATKEDIDKFIEKSRGEIRDELVKKDKFAIHVGEDQAKANFDKVFPLKMLIEKAENYEKVCKELGFDVDAMARLLEGCKETRKSFDDPNSVDQTRALKHEDVLVVESYVQMLKSKVYIKSYENSKNEDIFAPFDEVKFKELQEKVHIIFKENPMAAKSRDLFLSNDLITAVNEGDSAKIKITVQNAVHLGVDLFKLCDNPLINNIDSALDIAKRTESPEVINAAIERMLKGEAKTTNYKRGFFKAIGDGLKDFPKNLKYLLTPPPRSLSEIKEISGEKFDENKFISSFFNITYQGSTETKEVDKSEVTPPNVNELNDNAELLLQKLGDINQKVSEKATEKSGLVVDSTPPIILQKTTEDLESKYGKNLVLNKEFMEAMQSKDVDKMNNVFVEALMNYTVDYIGESNSPEEHLKKVVDALAEKGCTSAIFFKAQALLGNQDVVERMLAGVHIDLAKMYEKNDLAGMQELKKIKPDDVIAVHPNVSPGRDKLYVDELLAAHRSEDKKNRM